MQSDEELASDNFDLRQLAAELFLDDIAQSPRDGTTPAENSCQYIVGSSTEIDIPRAAS